MATPNRDGHRNTLHTLILTAVYNKHHGAVRRALEVIREQKLDEKKSKDGQRDGKQILDFLPQKKAPVGLPERIRVSAISNLSIIANFLNLIDHVTSCSHKHLFVHFRSHTCSTSSGT